MTFDLGTDEATDLTDGAGRCSSARCTSPPCAWPTTSAATPSASSTSRGSRTCCRRPTWSRACSTTPTGRPCTDATAGAVLYEGEALPHFNEVDEVRRPRRARHEPGLARARASIPPTTLHDLRWGERYTGPDRDGQPLDAFVWVFEISGAVPAAALRGRLPPARERTPAAHVLPARAAAPSRASSKPGEVVWSRVYVGRTDALHARPRPGQPRSRCPTPRPSAAGRPPPRSGR